MDIPANFSPESPGNLQDLRILQEDKWLMNTEVRYLLQERNSRWHLIMVYIAVHNPMQLICRSIDSYPSRRKAETFAKILQRGIRKDARGTLQTNEDGFDICTN